MERAAVFTAGPKFFKAEGKDYFVFTMDGGNKVGPREATDDDKEKYADAYKNAAEATDEEKVEAAAIEAEAKKKADAKAKEEKRQADKVADQKPEAGAGAAAKKSGEDKETKASSQGAYKK